MITPPDFVLAPDKLLAAEVARVLSDELAFIHAQVTRNDDLDEAVHQARKSIKRLRALLRLARPALEPGVYGRENTALRDIGRLLAPRRDATVRRKLVAGLGDTVDDSDQDALQTLLVAGAGEGVWAEVAGEVAGRLAELEARAVSWGLAEMGPEHLGRAVRRVYARGRRRMAMALETRVAAAWHEWRKEVKYLWHQVQLLEQAWPPLLIPVGEELHALSDALGDRHDLDIVLHIAAGTTSPALSKTLAERQLPLDRRATALGARIYAERPAAFAGRLVAYWTAPPIARDNGDDA